MTKFVNFGTASNN